MKTKVSILAILIFNLNIIDAQITPTPGPTGFATKNADVQVSTSTTIPHSEESISIDKINPLSLLISANTLQTVGAASGQGFYFSSDGGATWTGSDNLANSGIGQCDPCTVFDAAGQGYILSLGNITLIGGADGVVAQTTNDGGMAWNTQVFVTGGAGSSDDAIDKEMAGAIDEVATSAYVNFFYCAWLNGDEDNNQTFVSEIDFNKSTDGGNTFSAPIKISSGPGSGPNVQTGPNGEVYVCWADWTGIGANPLLTGPGKQIGFAADATNGGTTFSVSDAFGETGIFDRNEDATFGGTRVNDFPSMAVDKSCGPHRGRIYIAYTDGFDAGTNLIKVRFSDNKGSTWSTATTISTNTSFVQSWFPAIAVDDLSGLVNVLYYSIDQTTGFTTNTYLSYSTDGGGTWQGLKVSDASHTTAAITGYGFAPGYAGDYIAICSFSGHSYATWHDNRSGQWQVYVARIDFDMPLLSSSINDLNVNTPSTLNGNLTFQASNDLTSTSDNTAITVGSGANIVYTAGNEITLTSGFTSSSGSNFLAQINTSSCQTTGALSTLHLSATDTANINHSNNVKNLFCYPNPTQGNITLGVNGVPSEGGVTLEVTDMEGRILSSPILPNSKTGTYVYQYNTKELSAGVYFFTFISGSQKLTNKFAKLD